MHSMMDEAIEKRGNRLCMAREKGQTTSIWKMISSATEEAFIRYLKLENKEAQSMRGRGTPHFIKFTEDPGIPHELPIEKGAAAIHRIANRHGTQACRLAHMANTNKSISAGQKSDGSYVDIELGQRRGEQIDKTFANFSNDTNLYDQKEVDWKDKIEEAGRTCWQAYPVYKRAEAWHKDQQQKTRSQAFAANRKEKQEAMSCPTKGHNTYQGP